MEDILLINEFEQKEYGLDVHGKESCGAIGKSKLSWKLTLVLAKKARDTSQVWNKFRRGRGWHTYGNIVYFRRWGEQEDENDEDNNNDNENDGDDEEGYGRSDEDEIRDNGEDNGDLSKVGSASTDFREKNEGS